MTTTPRKTKDSADGNGEYQGPKEQISSPWIGANDPNGVLMGMRASSHELLAPSKPLYTRLLGHCHWLSYPTFGRCLEMMGPGGEEYPGGSSGEATTGGAQLSPLPVGSPRSATGDSLSADNYHGNLEDNANKRNAG